MLLVFINSATINNNFKISSLGSKAWKYIMFYVKNVIAKLKIERALNYYCIIIVQYI